MAIIKYQLVNGAAPEGITAVSMFTIGNDMIGIGSGVGTELSKSELLDYVLAGHAVNPRQFGDGTDPIDEEGKVSPAVKKSIAEVTAEVNDWCSQQGI